MSNDSSDDIVTHWNKINSKVMAVSELRNLIAIYAYFQTFEI